MNRQDEQLTFNFEQPTNPLEEVVCVLYDIVVLRDFETNTDINLADLNLTEQKRLLIAYAKDKIPEPWVADSAISLIETLHQPQYGLL